MQAFELFGGIFRRFVEPGQEVEYGQKLGVILDPFTAEVEVEITCPTSGVVFFALKKPLTTEHEVAFKVIRRLHGGCLYFVPSFAANIVCGVLGGPRVAIFHRVRYTDSVNFCIKERPSCCVAPLWRTAPESWNT